jgi:hypothetical protein
MRGDISERDERDVLESIRQIAEDLSERASEDEGTVAPAESEREIASDSASLHAIPILGCAAQDACDRLALELLAGLLPPSKWNMELVPQGTLTSELTEIVARERPLLVCIGSVTPGGLAHTRYLCKRLRARAPDVRIVVCRFGADPGALATSAPLRQVGAVEVTATFSETLRLLGSLAPILAQIHQGCGSEQNVARSDAAPGKAPPYELRTHAALVFDLAAARPRP